MNFLQDSHKYRIGYGCCTELTKVSGTQDVVPVPWVLIHGRKEHRNIGSDVHFYRTHRSVGYGYECLTQLTEVGYMDVQNSQNYRIGYYISYPYPYSHPGISTRVYPYPRTFPSVYRTHRSFSPFTTAPTPRSLCLFLWCVLTLLLGTERPPRLCGSWRWLSRISCIARRSCSSGRCRLLL